MRALIIVLLIIVAYLLASLYDQKAECEARGGVLARVPLGHACVKPL